MKLIRMFKYLQVKWVMGLVTNGSSSQIHSLVDNLGGWVFLFSWDVSNVSHLLQVLFSHLSSVFQLVWELFLLLLKITLFTLGLQLSHLLNFLEVLLQLLLFLFKSVLSLLFSKSQVFLGFSLQFLFLLLIEGSLSLAYLVDSLLVKSGRHVSEGLSSLLFSFLHFHLDLFHSDLGSLGSSFKSLLDLGVFGGLGNFDFKGNWCLHLFLSIVYI